MFAVGAGVKTAVGSGAFEAGEGTLAVSVDVDAKGVDTAMESDGNLARRVGDKSNLMIFDFDGLVENLEVMAAAAGVVIEDDMAMGWFVVVR